MPRYYFIIHCPDHGRSAHWVKSKNPHHAAVTRLLEEDWNG
jgi:hypothetical protein